MKSQARFLNFLLVIGPMVWSAGADAPADFTWETAPGGSVTASIIEFDVWMELIAEFVYDEDTPFDILDPNGEPDGIEERNAFPEPTLSSADYNENKIPDATEFALIAAIVNDTSHPLHNQVHEALKANIDQCQIDLGVVAESLAPALKIVMAAYATLGDGAYGRHTYGDVAHAYEQFGSWGALGDAIYELRDYASEWPAGAPREDDYQRMASILAPCEGDADSDAIPNINEFYGQGQDRLAFVAAALDPATADSAPDPYGVCGAAASGALWGTNFFYNPANRHVYYLTSTIPWEVAEDLAVHFTVNGTSVPAHLTEVRSPDENQWLLDHVVASAESTCHIGATDRNAEGVWVWLQSGMQFWQGPFGGHPVGGRYSNWNSGEPNNANAGEHAAEIYFNTGDGNGGHWNDNETDTSRRGIIEFTNGGVGYVDTTPANGYPDWWEPYVGVPLEGGGGEVDTDRDDDGMPNAWETANSLNPDDPTDAFADSDGDGLRSIPCRSTRTMTDSITMPIPTTTRTASPMLTSPVRATIPTTTATPTRSTTMTTTTVFWTSMRQA